MFRDLVECGGCHVEETIYGGYFCNETYCKAWFHKKCAEAPPEINHHPFHLEHPLLLTTNDSQTKDSPCDFCGKQLLSPCYMCPTCEFKLDFICGIKPSPCAIEHPLCHDHSLVFLKKRGEEEVQCEVCKESIGGPSYSCPECNNVYFHLDCVHLSKEVNHPCHPNHPLKLIAAESLNDDDYDHAEKFCRLCSIQPKKMLYHCSFCNFTLCLGCTKLPPPLVVNHAETHMHPLSLVSVNLEFTCKVCGVKGYDTKLYICLKCTFLVHGKCVGLPGVININRHDHRIYFTYQHGHGGCGVCRENVSHYYGAYSCSVFPNYTVHSRCAVDLSVWSGVELEGTQERDEDIAPFKVVGHNMIQHFSHSKHVLRLLKDNVIREDECMRCEACTRPLGAGPVYNCEECCFVLHEKCANLPKKKRLVFDPTPYTLECDNPAVYCKLCGMFSGGFIYTSKAITPFHYVDVHCGSFSEPVVHNKHSHPLYFVSKKYYICDACKRVPDDYMLSCAIYACNFDLCLYCASLQEKIRHMSDEHPLTLSSCVGNASGQNWCDVCESELDPSKWFFTCSDCEVAFHVQCVLGDFSRLKPECLYTFGEREFKVVINNHNTRPLCSYCHSRSKVPVILKDNGMDNGYICSGSCLSSCLGIEFLSPRNEM